MNATTASALSELRLIDPHLSDATQAYVTVAGDPKTVVASPRVLTAEIAGEGRMRTLDEWIGDTYGTSLLVVDHDTLVYEWYAHGLGPDTLFLGASMTKSVLAHLIGLAVTEGLLQLDERVTTYVPELVGTGYGDVRVHHLLTMTSGIDWHEDYRDPTSLASRLLSSFAAADGDSRALLRAIGGRHRPGAQYAYCTADSQVLDWVRERATGRTYAEDLGLLWTGLRCEHDAVVGVDAGGVPLAGGGVAASARDWARIGMLAIDGCFDGRRVLDAEWATNAVRPPLPYLEPGRLPSSISTHVGFGWHWWPLDREGRRVAADGSRGQFVYVDRAERVVVVKTSQWPYDDWLADRQYRDLSYLGLAETAAAAVRARAST